MSKVHILPEDKFVKNIQDFMDFGESVITECSEKKITTLNPNVVDLATKFANGKIKEKGHKATVEEFIKKTYDHWKHIKDKDTEHFSDKMHEIVPIVPREHLDEMFRLFTGFDSNKKGYVEKEDQDAFWDYLFSFIKISINYVHYNRKPVKTEEGFKYTQEFMKDFKVKDSAKMFEMELKI